MLDIYLNFRTVHIDSNNFLVDGWTSAVGYMCGFFLIDVVSTVPWDMLLSSSNDALGLVQVRASLIRTSLQFFHLGAENEAQHFKTSPSVSDTVPITGAGLHTQTNVESSLQLFKVSKLVKFVRIVRIFKLFRIMKLRRVRGSADSPNQ